MISVDFSKGTVRASKPYMVQLQSLCSVGYVSTVAEAVMDKESPFPCPHLASSSPGLSAGSW